MSLEIRPFPRPDWSPLPGAVGDGSGFTSVGAEAVPITAGQEVRWPEGALHRLWTEDSTMTTLMVEGWTAA